MACHRVVDSPARAPSSRPSILLVTLDTTRSDSIGPEQNHVETPSFNVLAKRGTRFRYAYATVPQTLPSHTSMLTGLYAAGHGVHENARYLADTQPLVAERLRSAGYRTAAFVSAFALARRFGLARGFDLYDDDFGSGSAERTSKETTDRALAWLAQPASQPTFLWVHFYDPHYPYTPPEPFRTRYVKQPYFGEIASMDEQLGRLAAAFERSSRGPVAMIIAGDHGDGLGDHGESQHGNLLYQSTMHVPLLIIGPGVAPGTSNSPVSTRRIFHTILDFAAIDASSSLKPRPEARGPRPEVVVGEAMKPFLDYGWQPQVMAVDGRVKTILAGRTETYDVVADPAETRDLSATVPIPRPVRAALHDYPVPSSAQPSTNRLDDEGRRKLASLGYVAATAAAIVRKDAPRPVERAHLFSLLDKASGLFVREQYAEAIPLLEKILSEDPHNLDAALRLATAYSALGRNRQAVAAFARAQTIAPDSEDVRTYLALHLAHGSDWQKAAPLLERVVTDDPSRLPAVEGLAVVRERQHRIQEAVQLWEKVFTMRAAAPAELTHVGQMAMAVGQTATAIQSFEKARALQGRNFAHDLELGVLLLAAGRLAEARDALDGVPNSSPAYPMAAFKRAQISVLLHEPDAPARIAMARQHADATTRELIAHERLFGK
ncbi:MAG: hypothetical protein NVSMB68_02640 [Thermoanaerobaculia bacterium]